MYTVSVTLESGSMLTLATFDDFEVAWSHYDLIHTTFMVTRANGTLKLRGKKAAIIRSDHFVSGRVIHDEED